MFTLQIQADSTNNLARIAALAELLIKSPDYGFQLDISPHIVELSLEWLVEKLNNFVDDECRDGTFDIQLWRNVAHHFRGFADHIDKVATPELADTDTGTVSTL